jgi:hypothetical protein
MAFTNETTHYGLPQWIGSDKPTYLVDQNNAYQKIDSEIYNANVAAGEAVTTANGASATAGAASATAADALSAAQTASTTADSALTAAQDAGTVAQAAQTAAGAAQTAAEAAQEAAAGNSITNLAPAYDSTITYAIDDLVTQDGKLYKCIVAVTSPEQFDINKWDDVTTSEVYARGIATVKFNILTFDMPATMHPNTYDCTEVLLDDNIANLTIEIIFESTDTATSIGWTKLGHLANRKHHLVQRFYGITIHDNIGSKAILAMIDTHDDIYFYNDDGTNRLGMIDLYATIIN